MPKVNECSKTSRKIYRKAALYTEYDVAAVITESSDERTICSSTRSNDQTAFENNDSGHTDVESVSDSDSSLEIDLEPTISYNNTELTTSTNNDVLEEAPQNNVIHIASNNHLDPAELAEWAINAKLPHVHLNSLLLILKRCNKNLPLDARTLLKSPRQLKLKSVTPGHYYHFGVKNAVQRLICSYRSELQSIDICVNIDGLPIAKSSCSQFYPILCNLYCNPNVVQIIGLYHGMCKPNDANDLLEDFVNEVISLTINGFDYNQRTYDFRVRAFICDAPAKSFISYTKGHTGYHSCSKCFIEGEYSDRIFFAETNNLIKRNDNNFRAKIDSDHHTGTSFIESIPNFDMVNGIPLDYMHLICLGVIKKLLLLWVTGKPPTKLSYANISAISQNLKIQVKNIPCELTRKPRSLDELKRWKATELRQFLIYTGPLVLKSILPYDMYLNFLCLHVATTILSSSKHVIALGLYAHELLKYFVESFIVLYGRKNVSHNIHNLLHIYEDTLNFGILQNFSAFPFENYLHSLKILVRKGDKPLSQVIKRLCEINNSMMNSVQKFVPDSSKPRASDQHFNGPTPNHEYWTQYKKLHFKNFTLKLSEADNCCSLINNSVVIIKNFVSDSKENIFILGNSFQKIENFYYEPCDSSQLGIYLVSNLGPLTTWSVHDIAFKYFKLTTDTESSVVFPLLHTDPL